MLNPQALPPVQYELVQFAGGIDQVTPAYSLPAGALRDCTNWAVNSQGGYYRIPGYERFSGMPAPSEATFTALAVEFAVGVALPAAGASVTVDGVTGIVCGISGAGAKYIVLTKYTGGMTVGNVIVFGATTLGTVTGWYGALTPKQLSQFKAAAAGIYRADIAPVPGSGPIRGVVLHNDVVYAFRDNAGGTAGAIYKSSSAGWVSVPLLRRVPFDALGSSIAEGVTISQGGNSARVRRVQVVSGAFAGGTAAGYLIIDNVVGTLTAATATVSSGGTVDLSGPDTAITIAPGGSYDFDRGNFTAAADTMRVYGVDGVNDGFEFDGEIYTPINIGATIKPHHVRVHRNHLFFAAGSSLIHSGVGQPYRYNVIDGAGEIGVGDRVSATLVQPGSQGGSALAVYGRGTTWVLYGSGSTDWNFVAFNVGMGAIPHTAQNMANSYVLDDRGIVAMQASLNYGNFDTATITHNIRPFIKKKRMLASASSVNRERSQYRVFFSDGYALYCTIANNQPVGHGIVQYPDVVRCAYDGEYIDGDAVSFFGTDSGHVMRNDIGTSFDGAQISAQLITNINTAKSPRIHKRFRRCVLELQGENFCEFSIGYSLDWASEDVLQHSFSDATATLSAASYWDAFFWDNFYWDGRSVAPAPVELNGSGENVQLIVALTSDHIAEFSLNSAILHYTQRRGNR